MALATPSHASVLQEPAEIRSDSANLDALRSLAVLFVVLSHLPALESHSVTRSGASFHLGALGLLGVAVFFVHTCLVLMLSLERQTQSHGERRRATTFFLRRAFRIYPLSILVVLLMATPGQDLIACPVTPRLLVSNILLIQNLTNEPSIIGPLWSLPFEVQMYLLLPALFTFIHRSGRSARFWVALMWLGAVALVLALWALKLNYHLVKYLPCFLPGVLAYCFSRSRGNASPAWLFAFVGIVALGLPWAVAHGAREHLAVWPVCLILGIAIPRCRELKSPLVRSASKIVARYSYGIYLVHVPCIAFAFFVLHGRGALIQWTVFIAGVTVLSWLAYHLIEKPAIRLGGAVAAWWSERDRAALALS